MKRFPLPTAIAAMLLLVALVPASATADNPVDHGGFVAEQPLSSTLRIKGNAQGDYVNAVSEVDGLVAAGGKFLEAQAPGGTAVPANNFALWSTADNRPLPAPQFDREVKAIEPTADGTGWYVAGIFKHVDGVYHRALVKVNRDGTVDETFDPEITWRVNDVELVGDVLYVAGDFDKINGQRFTSMAMLDATTGEPIPGWAPEFAGPYDTEDVAAFLYADKIEVTPDGTRLVVIGNFSSIDGQPRGRMAQFDITGPTPVLLDWAVQGYGIDQCRRRDTPQFITDLDVADGYVVAVTTGAYGSPTSYRYLCDTLARFELDDRGLDVRPTFLSYSGGDTLTQVEVVGDVIYVGGHQRWMNNPYGSDVKREGAVDRMGISAHNAVNGLPYSWDPGRSPRGWGVFELAATPGGLWVGQDTDYIGGVYTAFAGFLPYVGGTLAPTPTNGVLPVSLQVPQAGDDARMTFDGTTVTAAGNDATSRIEHTGLRAATRVGDDVLAAYANGTLLRYPERGAGAPVAVNLNGMDTSGRFRPSDLTSLAWDEVRQELVYTRSGDTRLRATGWNPESNIIGAQNRVVDNSAAGAWTSVRGAFIVDGVLYQSYTDGTLRSMPYGWRTVDVAARRTVSGPGVDGVTWNTPFFAASAGVPVTPNTPPTADLLVDCTDLECAVDATGSSDPDGTIVDWSIAATGTAGTPSIATPTGTLTFDQPGDATITLTVTDDDGATATTSRDVTVTAAPTASTPTLVGTSSRTYWARDHSVTVPAATPDGAVALLSVTSATKAVLPDSPSGLDGWTLLDEETTGNSQTRVWWAPADAADAGSTVGIRVSKGTSVQLGLSVWTGVDTASPVAAIDLGSSAAGSTHASPTVTTSASATVLELYAMKSDHAKDWVPGTDQTVVIETHGTGGAHLSVLLTRRDAVPAGTVGGTAATVDATDRGVTVGTIVLRAG